MGLPAISWHCHLGPCLALCAFISIPAVQGLLPVGSVFAGHLFPLVTAISGFSLVLSGAESAAISLNIRHLNFQPIVTIDLARGILSLPIALIWAWISPSVWAVIGAGLAGAIFRLMLSHIVVPGPRMALKWRRDHFEEIRRFGMWIVVSSGATFVSQQSDVILLGLLMPSSALGIYSIAKLLVGAAEGILVRLNNSLALPVLGEVIRKDRGKLRDRYYRFRLPIEFAAALLSGFLFAAGIFIVHFLYDPRYSQAGQMLQILALGLAIYPLLDDKKRLHRDRGSSCRRRHRDTPGGVTSIIGDDRVSCIRRVRRDRRRSHSSNHSSRGDRRAGPSAQVDRNLARTQGYPCVWCRSIDRAGNVVYRHSSEHRKCPPTLAFLGSLAEADENCNLCPILARGNNSERYRHLRILFGAGSFANSDMRSTY